MADALFPAVDHIFALELHIDGVRVHTHRLTKHQAECARIAARHLTRYLTEAYELDHELGSPLDHLECARCGQVQCICARG